MAREILHRERILPHLQDTRYRQHKGRWLIPRLLPDQQLTEDWERLQGTSDIISSVELGEAGPLKLSAKGDGTLNKLVFEENTAVGSVLLSGHVEIRIKAVGVNMIVSIDTPQQVVTCTLLIVPRRLVGLSGFDR